MENPLGQSLRELPGPLLLTGHTGFKGTWMTLLLKHLHVPVIGFSLAPEEESLFNLAGRSGAIPEVFADIRDYKTLEKFIDENRPSTIIHMAAQPLVLESYLNPRETFDINVMGTVNVLDVAFRREFVKAIIVVTTDKVYRNDNSGRAFVESDPLEGRDPYSASKVGTEAVVNAWQQIAKVSGGPKVVSVRAGNVIGGGDFAANRILPDLVRGFISGNPIEIRNPESTRPWQHVLDPLWGYLLTLEEILDSEQIVNVNFSPTEGSLPVASVVELVKTAWSEIKIETPQSNLIDKNRFQVESKELHLDSNLAKNLLGWTATYTQQESVISTVNWWTSYLSNEFNAKELCEKDIAVFLESNSFHVGQNNEE
jgi:CDP-glucose 4,6-dehydratase